MRIRSLLLGVASLAMVAIGLVVVAYAFVGQGTANTASNSTEPEGFNVPEVETTRERGAEEAAQGPEDKTLRVTIPKMARIEGATFPDAAGDDEEALKNNAGIHLEGTGFPWEDGANTYLAGHRLGYPNEPSFLAFWDLDALENGDEVFVEDADGNEYTYRVFKEFVVSPTDLYVTEPVPGKDVLTLQTCTLPDYSRRLIVQAEKV
ncbi:class E sortase [Rubrobacter marinus]|nr:class E sortase [Rubrobacter marinus]